MCKALKFSRSTYYKALLMKPSNKRKEYETFSEKVMEYYLDNKKRYGAVKLCKTLNDNGIPCSVPDDKENILKRDFTTTTINEKWVTDITYIHVLNEGWTYLASVMDLHDRKIIGWSYGKNITAQLALQAVKNAVLNVKDTEGIIIHSDLGSQYTSQLFEDYMTEQKIKHSFSRKGNPYDNACIESFHSIMKKEEIYLHEYQDFEEAKPAIFEYIESWYNRKRIHSALGYKTPQQVEDEAVQVA